MSSTKVMDIVSAIHKKVREQSASYESPVVLEEWSSDLAKLHSAYNSAYCARNVVGIAPPMPRSILGIVAGWVIGIAQRMLFWYTPQIRQFHEAATGTLNRICSLEERQFRVFLSMANRLETLERETRLLRATQHPATASPQAGPYTASTIDSSDFYFQLQGRFQSTAHADATHLELYFSAIAALDPKVPDGPWLDIGCGRGQWLQRVRDGGRQATGVDANPAAVQQCQAAGFEVAGSDALQFLQAADAASFAVISAFHVLEHLPFDYCLNLVYQAARTLKPGGILVIETPNPASLLMAAEQFWLDPTHHRPIPMPLMEFLFEYCGLRMVHRFEINPREESEHLPLRELELANRLDHLLYGPQDYAVIGRRDG